MKHFLIVGGGLAGLTLADHLLKEGQKVTICEKGSNKSSVIAAGLINPMVFRRMTKSWRVDEFVPFAQNYYSKIEESTGQHFFHPIIIRRFFAHEHERNLWLEKQKEFSAYLEKITEEDQKFAHPKSKNPFGTGRVKNGSWIDVILFLTALRKKLESQGVIFTNHEINEREIIADDYTFQGECFDGVIFCNGFELVHSELFKGKMINPTKGQVLTINSKEVPSNESINRKCFVLPLGDSKFKVGSTYEWQTTDDTITEEGKQEILGMLKYLGDYAAEVLEQKAGIRPATFDRRPIMGTHPEHLKLHVFNGLGTKGYMMAPLLAKEMTEYLLKGKELDSECNVLRFMK